MVSGLPAFPEAISSCSTFPFLPLVVGLGVDFGAVFLGLVLSFGVFALGFLAAVWGALESVAASVSSGDFLLRLVSEFIWPVIRPLGKQQGGVQFFSLVSQETLGDSWLSG